MNLKIFKIRLKQAIDILFSDRADIIESRDFVENANDLIQSVDSQGRFMYVNKKWRETMGYTSKEVRSLTFMDTIHPEHLQACIDIFKQISAGVPITSLQTVFITKDKKKIYVEGNISSKMEYGKLIATRGIFRDVTAQKEMEIKLLNEGADADRLAKKLVHCELENFQLKSKLELLKKGLGEF